MGAAVGDAVGLVSILFTPLLHGSPHPRKVQLSPEESEQLGDELRMVIKDIKERLGKPLVVVQPHFPSDIEILHLEEESRRTRDYCLEAGIPVYPSIERAATAVAKVRHYYRKVSLDA